ncbi:MAG: DUF3095 family protein [Ferruginibacter sp.]
MSINFYTDLKPLSLPVNELLSTGAYFVSLPQNWHIIVADIANSTEVVKAGRHTDINLVAAGSLIAALNVARSFQTDIPYFFGGDGGIVIVPEDLVQPVLAGLKAHRINSLKNFALDIRIGSVPVSEITKAGFEINIAKVAIGPELNRSVVLGDGLKYAETVVKQNYRYDEKQKLQDLQDFDISALNLQGLECRWDKIKPPTKGLEVVCLLVEATHVKDQLTVYNNVLKKLDEFYGETGKRHPLSVNRLRLINSFKKFQHEMLLRYSKRKIGYLVKLFFQTIIGKLYFKYNLKVNNLRAGDYLAQVIEFSDTLTIDGRINTIVSGTAENRELFLKYLAKEEQEGRLLYGHHVSAESIMTCYIENMNNKHIHFVDGADGGYTEAALELKSKFKRS